MPPAVAAIVLAAGESRRMGGTNKLTLTVDGVPLVARVVDAALASRADPVVVVTGFDDDAVRRALAGRPVQVVHNPAYGEGMSTSLRCGLGAVPATTDGAVVCLADMPRLTAAVIDRLIGAFDPARGTAACVPAYRGRRGNPVLLSRDLFASAETIVGDRGARDVVAAAGDAVAVVDWDDDSVVFDVDEPGDLEDRG